MTIYLHHLLRIQALVIVLLVLGSIDVKAQDPHFSQFYASPLTLNPALAGTAGGNYRVAVNYRDQWRGALDNPLKTFSAAGDLRHEIGEGKNRPDIASGGFMFFSDQVGDFDLNTNQIGLIGAYHKSLNKNYNQYLGVGAQIGLIQKGINYEDLFFQDQFNSIDDFNLPTGELLPANNFAFIDFTVGINYSTTPDKDRSFFGGISYAHLSTPNVSFYRTDDTPNPTLIRENALHAKITGYVGASYRTSVALQVQPRALLLLQGPHAEVNIGTNLKYKFLASEGKYLHFGPWLRGVKNENGFGVESIVASVGFELKSFLIGFSYDHNISDLISDRQGLNALEISLIYIGEHDDIDSFCPTF